MNVAKHNIIMMESQPNEARITVTCEHCKRKGLDVTFTLPTDQCSDGHTDCAWQLEVVSKLAIKCCSNARVEFSSSLEKSGTSVDKGALDSSVGIVIIGKPGAGKTTVVKQGLFPDCTIVQEPEVEDPQLRIMTCINKEVKYKIVMISNIDCNKKADPDAGWRKLYDLKDKFPHNISLILFVYGQGRFTDENKELFLLGKQCFQSASNLCATVVTNCDGMTPEAKKKIVADFKGNSKTTELAKFMKKEPSICCVSFPDLDKLDPQLQEVYKQESLASQSELSKLLQPNESNNMNIDEVLKEPPQQKRFGSTFSSIIHGPWRPQP